MTSNSAFKNRVRQHCNQPDRVEDNPSYTLVVAASGQIIWPATCQALTHLGNPCRRPARRRAPRRTVRHASRRFCLSERGVRARPLKPLATVYLSVGAVGRVLQIWIASELPASLGESLRDWHGGAAKNLIQGSLVCAGCEALDDGIEAGMRAPAICQTVPATTALTTTRATSAITHLDNRLVPHCSDGAPIPRPAAFPPRSLTPVAPSYVSSGRLDGLQT